MAEFDTISKHLMHTHPVDFVRFSLDQDDVEVVEILDTEQPTVETRRTDSLIRVHIGGEEALVHHEFQTTNSTHPPMPRRMAGYIGRGLELHGLPIYSHVIYLRPDAGRADPGHYLQDRTGYRVVVQYRVIRLIEIDGERIFRMGHTGLLPFAPLMRPPAEMASAAWLRQCIHAAAELPLARSVKADFLAGLTLLSGLVYDSETIRNLSFQEGIMDIVRESSFAQYLTKQGIEQGIEQGIRESILEVLALRFDVDAAQQLAARIGAIDEVPRLKQLHRAAIQASSLPAFRDLLEATDGNEGPTRS